MIESCTWGKYGIIENNIPFHTYALLENPKTKLSTAQAKFFIKSMREFIELVPMDINIIYTDKIVFRRNFGITKDSLKGSRENNEKRGRIIGIYF